MTAAGRMDPEFRRLRLQHATIDTWIATYRAGKTIKRGMPAAGRILVARAAQAFTRVIFALEHRWVPLHHWLEKELKTLQDEAQVGPLLLAAVMDADPAPINSNIPHSTSASRR